MRNSAALLAAFGLALSPLPALAQPQAVNFTIVNNTAIPFAGLKIRRYGTQDWVPLTVAPLPVAGKGGQGAVTFSNQDCAFDLQATLPDGKLVLWTGVNLCEAKVVTLNQTATGELWVDYR